MFFPWTHHINPPLGDDAPPWLRAAAANATTMVSAEAAAVAVVLTSAAAVVVVAGAASHMPYQDAFTGHVAIVEGGRSCPALKQKLLAMARHL